MIPAARVGLVVKQVAAVAASFLSGQLGRGGISGSRVQEG